MANRKDLLLLWSPRVLGILVCLSLSLFALDAFEGGKTFLQGLSGFLIHITPMLILLAVVALSWQWKLLGSVVFIAVAVAYAVFAVAVRHRPDWIPPIAGPLLAVGVLYLLSWMHCRKPHPFNREEA